MKSNELEESAEKARKIEEAIEKAEIAQYAVEDALVYITDFVEEPHGWASENWYNVVSQLEKILEFRSLFLLKL